MAELEHVIPYSDEQIDESVQRSVEEYWAKASDVTTLNGKVLSIEGNIDEINNDLVGKQDKLVAGANITISGNVISASGGGGGGGGIDGVKLNGTAQPVVGGYAEVTVDASTVGLGNVDNTSDADKPVSTAQQAALNGKQATIIERTVSLMSSTWSSGSQTVNVSGVTSTSKVIVSPSPDSLRVYAEAGVYCSAQGTGTLTFKSDSTPSEDLEVIVLIA